MGGKNLSDDQIHILGDESVNWHLNDGIVNTESMKGPLNRNGDLADNRNKELITDAREFPFQDVQTARGKYWHFGVTASMDHADEIGIFIEENTVNRTAVLEIRKQTNEFELGRGNGENVQGSRNCGFSSFSS